MAHTQLMALPNMPAMDYERDAKCSMRRDNIDQMHAHVVLIAIRASTGKLVGISGINAGVCDTLGLTVRNFMRIIRMK